MFAQKSWRSRNRMGAQPSSYMWNLALRATAAGAAWEAALVLLKKLPQATVVSFNSTAAALAAGQQWARNLWLLKEQSKARLHVDLISFNSLQHALAGAVRWQLALQWLRKGGDLSLEPDDAPWLLPRLYDLGGV